MDPPKTGSRRSGPKSNISLESPQAPLGHPFIRSSGCPSYLFTISYLDFRDPAVESSWNLKDCFGHTICVPHQYNGRLVQEGEDRVNYAASSRENFVTQFSIWKFSTFKMGCFPLQKWAAIQWLCCAYMWKPSWRKESIIQKIYCSLIFFNKITDFDNWSPLYNRMWSVDKVILLYYIIYISWMTIPRVRNPHWGLFSYKMK